MNRPIAAIALTAAVTSCANMTYPQNAAEYRARVGAAYTEKFEVGRSLASIAPTLRTKTAECLDVTVTRRWTEPQGAYSIPRQTVVKYRPVVVASAGQIELQLQMDDGNQARIQKEPEGGMYLLVVDLIAVGKDRTRVEIYGGGDYFYGGIAEGVKQWIRGASLACPQMP